MKRTPRARRAFTLVEVVVALGVFTFCSVSLVGLFSVGLSNSRKSSEDTAIASMSSQIFDILRAENTNAAGQTLTYYFDVDGQMTNAASYFVCDTSFYAASAKGLTDTAENGLLLAQLRFRWPTQAIPAPYTNVVNLAIPPAGS
jgi:uncharacterized protein (TIGR02598 family)